MTRSAVNAGLKNAYPSGTRAGTTSPIPASYLGHRDPKHTVHYTRVAGRRFGGLSRQRLMKTLLRKGALRWIGMHNRAGGSEFTGATGSPVVTTGLARCGLRFEPGQGPSRNTDRRRTRRYVVKNE
jgi:hypothetical protein